ncbi:sensor histidine kinase KdpD [Pleurocapsa sp. PCC 7319]|uniref:sensor histidine kinase n=1 Tax=Pleurocapsa sp. PCC 7319 TaxID=118161 RepID=UPI0003450D62|nr:HAMP domain-containing sensor histidine kinase [Pleurocapsa sp. PCC 7319]
MTPVEKVVKEAQSPEFQEKLATFKHIESNLISVIGYELWNPLSTIQVCLETLANESSSSVELNQILLETGIQDVKYLRQLIQDCINISQSDSTAQCDRSREIHNILEKSLEKILNVYQVTGFSYLVPKNDKDSSSNECPGEVLEHINSNFIAIVGHELRTPLCTIQVCLESLSNELEASDECEEYKQKMLEIALNDFERLRQLIKDFFILARLKQGQVYYRQEYVEVQALLELALTSLKNQKYDHPLPKIDIELPFYLPRIKTDGDRLVEAITKVLDNACKFNQPQGEIKIQVKLLNQNTEQISNLSISENKSFLEVIISDTGRGIAPNNLNAIFNCFYQEENALKRTVNGVGIGLTICYQIIQSLGGKIWANSAGKEQGSSIHFTVPVTM